MSIVQIVINGIRNCSVLLVAFLALTPLLRSQAPVATPPPAGPIQDNSFLVEEAYNQETGVVQHINTFTRLWNSNQWAYTFTQEWPVPHHWRNQLSYSVNQARPDPVQDAGFGDVLINYRYQVVGTGEARVAFAPRLSFIAPTGSWRKATGYGGAGLQTCLPASVVLTRSLVAHSNLGGTWIPSARDRAGNRAASYGYYAGQSVVWLASPRFNVLLESVYNSSHLVSGPHATQPLQSFLLVPGVRWAHNFKSGLQIVPGVAYVAGVGPSQGQRGLFLYLSFEHPWWHEREGVR